MKTICRWCPAIAGVLLLVAAGLKVTNLVEGSGQSESTGSSWPITIAVFGAEAVIGTVLLAGIVRNLALLVASGIFLVFALFHLEAIFNPRPTCGCLGPITPNSHVMIALDLVMGCSLFAVSIIERRYEHAWWKWGIARGLLVGVSAVVVFASYLRISSATPMLPGPTAPVAAVTRRVTHNEMVSWIGRRLPLVDAIDIGQRLSSGRWQVKFVNWNCSDCRRQINRHNSKMPLASRSDTISRFAFVEVPPYAPDRIRERIDATWGRLDSRIQWMIPTPSTLVLNDGNVVSVADVEATGAPNH